MNSQELISKWNHVLWQSHHIFTWTGGGELAYLAEQATKANCAIEMGVYMGRSAKVMLDADAPRLFRLLTERIGRLP